MSAPALALLPNVAAEEGDWRRLGDAPAVQALVAVWRQLFGPAELDAPPGRLEPCAQHDAPVFPWLDAPDAACAWLNTAEAEHWARERGRRLLGADAECVARVHDKAFAQRAALAGGQVPRVLREVIHVLEPAELRDADTALAAIRARSAAWPAAWRDAAVLKPRFGTSGRGRVACGEGLTAAALERLAARGGALLEPWLPRTADLSAQLWIADDGELRVLGTLEQRVSGAGVYRGHRGLVDSRGRVVSGGEDDEALREAGAAIALDAREAGYRGPCGVDAFRFETPEGDGCLRPVVELNARYTAGIVAIGAVRRALPQLRARLGLEPGTRCAFHFALEPPAPRWPDPVDPERSLLLPLAQAPRGRGPALALASDAPVLAEWLGA